MAEALIKGGLAAKAFSPEQVVATDIKADTLQQLEKKYHIKTSLNNIVAVEKADIVLLAIKPQQVEAVLKEVGAVLSEKKLIISIAAGVPIRRIQADKKWKVVRVMPNTPALIGAGMTVLSASSNVTDPERARAEAIFSAVGLTLWLEETQLNAVTALSGSGPAFVYRFVEYMAAGGETLGLTAKTAYTLALQTFLGSVQMLKVTGETPEALVQKVSSPNGTTVAGRSVLEKSATKQIIFETLAKAKIRADELTEGA